MLIDHSQIEGLGTAGTPSGGVVTVQGATAGTPVPARLLDANGVAIGARSDGFLRAQIDPTTLLFDTFETLDTTNTWTIGGTVAPSGVNGTLQLSPGTAANASTYAKSIPSFIPGASAYLQFSSLVQIESGVVTGNQRFWGLGTFTTPTVSAPIGNGTVYEIDSATGGLFASVYSNSVRTSFVSLTKPTDGATHRYAIYYKASRVYFEIDNVTVASIAFPNPQVSALNTVIGSVNGTSALATASALNATLIGVGDTGRNSTKISDGTFPWRKAQVNADGSQLVAQQGFSNATNTFVSVTKLVATLVLAANPLRKYFSIANNTTSTVQLQFGSGSGLSATTGFQLSTQGAGVYESKGSGVYTGAIYAYTSITLTLSVCEGTL